jgi:hypothetical protein
MFQICFIIKTDASHHVNPLPRASHLAKTVKYSTINFASVSTTKRCKFIFDAPHKRDASENALFAAVFTPCAPKSPLMRTKITAYARQKSPLIKDAISPVFNLAHNLIQLGPLPNQMRAIFQLK